MVAIPIYLLTNSARGLPFLHILPIFVISRGQSFFFFLNKIFGVSITKYLILGDLTGYDHLDLKLLPGSNTRFMHRYIQGKNYGDLICSRKSFKH